MKARPNGKHLLNTAKSDIEPKFILKSNMLQQKLNVSFQT
jgi:hypothetical protein